MRWLLLTVFALHAATCGQSGPLRLPDESLAPSPTELRPGLAEASQPQLSQAPARQARESQS